MRDSAYLRRNAGRRDRAYADRRAERSAHFRALADLMRTRTMDTKTRHGTPVTAEQISQAQDPRGRASVSYQQDEQVLTAEELAFREAHKGVLKAAVLMSGTNPTGFKLEDLLKKLRSELETKNARLVLDESSIAQAIVRANQRISACMFEAEGIQRTLVALLLGVGPDKGPLGRPRVGLGSKA